MWRLLPTRHNAAKSPDCEKTHFEEQISHRFDGKLLGPWSKSVD
jgi:hypothetical protein